jgi:16S rRNA (cytosine967-C5)-methyltransferase
MKLDNQLRYAVLIIKNFRGESPLHNWLKQFFRQNKQMGSKDRKQVAGMVYSFYRLGKALRGLAIEERILAGMFLCNQTGSEILQYHKPAWNDKISLPGKEKYKFLGTNFSPADIFPWEEELSSGIDFGSFCESFFIQPDLFLRIRPGKEKIVIQKLQNASVPFRQMDPCCIALANTTKLDNLIDINRDAVIQDYSSQHTGDLIDPDHCMGPDFKVWDCCAASGGKSILAYDRNPGIDLTVSDIRESMLVQLKSVFGKQGLTDLKPLQWIFQHRVQRYRLNTLI